MFRKFIKISVFIIAFLLFEVFTLKVAYAATYYVSLSGNNSNPGTSDKPFQTIQKGINAAYPGDTVIVKPGTYTGNFATYGHAEFNPNVENGRSGTSAARITLKAEFPATNVASSQRTLLQGAGGANAIYINGQSYINIEGFEFYNWDVGLNLGGNANNLIVRKNIFRSNNGAGVQCANCSNSSFEYNQFLDPGPAYDRAVTATQYGTQDYAINFYQNSMNNNVVHNYFFGKHHQVVSWKRKAGPGYAAYNTFDGCMYSCIYLGQNDDESAGGDMTSYDVTVEHNVFRDAVDNGFGSYKGAVNGTYYRLRSPITIRNIQNAVVRNNFVENDMQAPLYIVGCEGGYYCQTSLGKDPVGAKVYGNTFVNTKNYQAFEISGRGYSPDNIEIYNNTVYNALLAFTISGFTRLNDPVPSKLPPNLTIKNNNLVNVGNGVSGNLTTTTFGYNNWYPNNTKKDVTDFNIDPKFQGPIVTYDPYANKGPNPVYNPDFSRAIAYKLALGSLLTDAGVNVDLAFQGTKPDIGSNEFISGISSSVTQSPQISTVLTNIPSPSPSSYHSFSMPCTLPGDTKQNGICDSRVDMKDFNYLKSLFSTSNLNTDLQPDGFVNILDYIVLSNNYKKVILVTSSADDAYTYSGGFNYSKEYINIPSWAKGYFRFISDIPKGVQLSSVYLNMRTYGTYRGNAIAHFKMIDSGNCSDFKTTPYDLPTVGDITWTSASTADQTWIKSNDLKSLVQAFINRSDYQPGNAMCIVWSPEPKSADRAVWSVDGIGPKSSSGLYAPYLEVNY